MVKKYSLLLLFLLLTSCNQQKVEPAPEPGSEVKNVILMIGDGMGLAHINAARLTVLEKNKTFTIDTLPVTGLVKTSASNHLITDSAAAATALATGHKTRNKRIGMSPFGRPLKNILEAAKEKNMSTGLIATSSITHATTAAFAAHVEHRKQQSLIAEQILDSQIDILLGGGKGFFIPKSTKESLRDDEQDLIEKARSKGYTLLESRDELLSNTDDKVLGLFAREGLKFTKNEPSLAEITKSALERVSSNPAGFFLVIEGSQIDWAAHHKDAEETIRQTVLFDEAVAVALEFAKKDRETLLLVTADHETGGMAINEGNLDGSDLQIEWTTKHHTAIDVPIFAYGPQATDFTGVMDNIVIPKKLASYLKIKL